MAVAWAVLTWVSCLLLRRWEVGRRGRGDARLGHVDFVGLPAVQREAGLRWCTDRLPFGAFFDWGCPFTRVHTRPFPQGPKRDARGILSATLLLPGSALLPLPPLSPPPQSNASSGPTADNFLCSSGLIRDAVREREPCQYSLKERPSATYAVLSPFSCTRQQHGPNGLWDGQCLASPRLGIRHSGWGVCPQLLGVASGCAGHGDSSRTYIEQADRMHSLWA